MRIQRILYLILCMGIFIIQSVGAEDMPESVESIEKSESKKLLSPVIVAVKFHADWCSESNQFGNIMTDLQNRFDGNPVLFITFDRTNISTRNRAKLLASALNLQEIYKKYQGTGFIVLIDWKSKKDLKTLTPENSIDVIVQSVANAMVSP
jgi:hypothetical protein